MGTYALGITQIRCGFSPFLTVTIWIMRTRQETGCGFPAVFCNRKEGSQVSGMTVLHG